MQRSQILTTLLFLVASLTSCNAGRAYDHSYDDYNRLQSASPCSFERYLGSGEYFEFPRFPPPPPDYGRSSPRCSPYLTPDECTWTFMTDDSCTLEYYTNYFWRGDIDCGQQHFFIGDEDTEMRICGFDRPPKHFRSTGRALFLGHYQQNRYCPTVSSVIEGVVHCVKGTRAGYQCPPATAPQPDCKTLGSFHGLKKGVGLTVNGTFGGTQFTVSNTCNSTTCNATATACVQQATTTAGAYAYACNETPAPPLPEDCHDVTVPCPHTGDCSGVDHIIMSGSGDVDISCNATHYQLCTEVVTVCAVTTTP